MHKFLCFEYEGFGFLSNSTTNIVWKVHACNNLMADIYAAYLAGIAIAFCDPYFFFFFLVRRKNVEIFYRRFTGHS